MLRLTCIARDYFAFATDLIVDFGLAQIYPVSDEGTDADPKIISASFTDPCVLLILDDGKIIVLRADESGDLDEVEQGDRLKTKGIKSGCLYEDSNDVFRLESDEDLEEVWGNILMFLLTEEGGLLVCSSHRIESLIKSIRARNPNIPFIDFSSFESGRLGLQGRRLEFSAALLDARLLGPQVAGKGKSDGNSCHRAWRCSS